MVPYRYSAFLLFLLAIVSPLAAFTQEDAEGRLRMARQIARERNDAELVRRVEALAREFKADLPADAEQRLRQAETAVGIDPGGWSMAGQPLFHPSHNMEAALKAIRPKLEAAMTSGDAQTVLEITDEMERILGDQAGVPDGRRMGQKATTLSLTRADAVKLFLDALATQGRMVRTLSAGQLLPDQMARVYAYVLDACDPHNARSVYHIIILRALTDLGRSEEVDAVTRPALHALLTEFEAMGITVEALPELHAISVQHPENTRLHDAVRNMAAVIVSKCTDGTRVKMGAQPHQLAAVAELLAE